MPKKTSTKHTRRRPSSSTAKSKRLNQAHMSPSVAVSLRRLHAQIAHSKFVARRLAAHYRDTNKSVARWGKGSAIVMRELQNAAMEWEVAHQCSDGSMEAPGLDYDFANKERAIFRAFYKLRRHSLAAALQMHGEHGLAGLVHQMFRARDDNGAFGPAFIALGRELSALLRGLTAVANHSNGLLVAAQECGVGYKRLTVLQYLQHHAPREAARATTALERWSDALDADGYPNGWSEHYEGDAFAVYHALMETYRWRKHLHVGYLSRICLGAGANAGNLGTAGAAAALVPHIASRDPERFPKRTAGISWQNLNPYGYGNFTDYQKSVLNGC
ncbi:hypothetical protein PENSPDRAFT_671151 [Peniophora sp. CONT]|nr:hypothetical protein PENSPDRAFT_671151 [Peniophora sp. CONT]